MLIEPAILMLFNSMRLANQGSGALAAGGLSFSLTSMSFDFLCRIVNNFHLPLRDHVLNGLMQAFKDSVDKRVIPSLQGFFAATTTPSDKNAQGSNSAGVLDRDLRALVQATFGNFFQTLSISPVPSMSSGGGVSGSQTPLAGQSPVLMARPSPSSSPTIPSISIGESISPTVMAPTPSIGVTFQNTSSLFRQQKPTIPVSTPIVDDMPSTTFEPPPVQQPAIVKMETQEVSLKIESQGKICRNKIISLKD